MSTVGGQLGSYGGTGLAARASVVLSLMHLVVQKGKPCPQGFKALLVSITLRSLTGARGVPFTQMPSAV